ncbi:hypothetical protein FB451DRAFT_1369158 [Mycena latifolia]|nr:hypothetical protein FB451DRAFT_1369158 [Mycena latifolia]
MMVEEPNTDQPSHPNFKSLFGADPAWLYPDGTARYADSGHEPDTLDKMVYTHWFADGIIAQEHVEMGTHRDVGKLVVATQPSGVISVVPLKETIALDGLRSTGIKTPDLKKATKATTRRAAMCIKEGRRAHQDSTPHRSLTRTCDSRLVQQKAAFVAQVTGDEVHGEEAVAACASWTHLRERPMMRRGPDGNTAPHARMADTPAMVHTEMGAPAPSPRAPQRSAGKSGDRSAGKSRQRSTGLVHRTPHQPRGTADTILSRAEHLNRPESEDAIDSPRSDARTHCSENTGRREEGPQRLARGRRADNDAELERTAPQRTRSSKTNGPRTLLARDPGRSVGCRTCGRAHRGRRSAEALLEDGCDARCIESWNKMLSLRLAFLLPAARHRQSGHFSTANAPSVVRRDGGDPHAGRKAQAMRASLPRGELRVLDSRGGTEMGGAHSSKPQRCRAQGRETRIGAKDSQKDSQHPLRAAHAGTRANPRGVVRARLAVCGVTPVRSWCGLPSWRRRRRGSDSAAKAGAPRRAGRICARGALVGFSQCAVHDKPGEMRVGSGLRGATSQYLSCGAPYKVRKLRAGLERLREPGIVA